ncbi:hypothetical protein OSB04_021603 [Centaurea solstitialis]|uniref:Protein FAR1-RELATED SEQUENCE n=1 Tax=Centaurea solstitialis TaxID=347529 RepID=A0AA38SUH2_9ASTR|nr:hypothetical protein OSB04_021603 [Centaurea solstitialis]
MDSDAVENSTLFVDEKFEFPENFDDVDSISSTDDEYDEFSTSSSSSKVDSSSYQNNTGDETSSSGVEIDCVNSLQLWTPEVPDGLKPVVGQMFESLDKGIEMYKKYAVIAGFDIRLSCVKKNKLKDIILRYVVCNREGIPEPIQKNTLDSAKKKVRMTSIHRTGCGAGVKFKVCSDGKSFILYDFEEKHNHCLFDEDSKHMLKSKRKLDYSQQRFILKMSNANIGATQAHNIICQLKGGYDKVGGTKVEYKNFQRDRNCYIGDSDANLFVRKMNNRKLYIPNFSFEYNSDGGLLKYAFWADDTAKHNFQEFGDIVSFDATYRTNKSASFPTRDLSFPTRAVEFPESASRVSRPGQLSFPNRDLVSRIGQSCFPTRPVEFPESRFGFPTRAVVFPDSGSRVSRLGQSCFPTRAVVFPDSGSRVSRLGVSWGIVSQTVGEVARISDQPTRSVEIFLGNVGKFSRQVNVNGPWWCAILPVVREDDVQSYVGHNTFVGENCYLLRLWREGEFLNLTSLAGNLAFGKRISGRELSVCLHLRSDNGISIRGQEATEEAESEMRAKEASSSSSGFIETKICEFPDSGFKFPDSGSRISRIGQSCFPTRPVEFPESRFGFPTRAVVFPDSGSRVSRLGQSCFPTRAVEFPDSVQTVGEVARISDQPTRYCMVYVPFTGIDNHKNCVTLGAGILDSEDGNAFKWLLEAFLKSFGKQPKLVVTDQCPAIKHAVRENFKESRHRFCMWHISEKLPAKVKHNVLSNGDFKKRFHCLIWDENIDANEFEERWTSLMTEFSLQGHKWLKYMFKNRHRWIPSFYRDIPMARLMRTTSRSESENSFFSQFFHYGATLMKFIDSFDSAMDKQRNNHRLLNHKTKTTLPKLLTPLPIEVHASKIYTRSVFKDVQNEIYQSLWSCFQSSMTLVDGSDVIVIVEKKKIQQKSTDDHTANANSYIKSIEQKNLGIEEIPTKYIMKRWRKDLISSELLKKRHWDGEGNEHLKELENDAQFIFDDCLGIVVNDIKKFEAFVSKMKSLKTELEAAGCTVAQKGKEKIMESLLGVSKPDIVDVGNPKDINNKGSGTGKRLKSGKEKAIEKRQKVARLCRLCGEYAFHDSRNCPSRAEEEEEE